MASSEDSTVDGDIPRGSVVYFPEPARADGKWLAKVVVDLRHSDSFIVNVVFSGSPYVDVGGQWGTEIIRPRSVPLYSGIVVKQVFDKFDNAVQWQTDITERVKEAIEEARLKFSAVIPPDFARRYVEV